MKNQEEKKKNFFLFVFLPFLVCFFSFLICFVLRKIICGMAKERKKKKKHAVANVIL